MDFFYGTFICSVWTALGCIVNNSEFGWTVPSDWVLFACLICCLQCRGPLSTSSPLPSILSVLGSPNWTTLWKLPVSLPAWRATLPQYSRDGGAHADGVGRERRRQDPGQTCNVRRESPVPSRMGKCERVLRTCVWQRKRKGLETSRCIIRVCMVTSRGEQVGVPRSGEENHIEQLQVELHSSFTLRLHC